VHRAGPSTWRGSSPALRRLSSKRIALLAAGLIAGLFSGLLGVGGGIVIVPLLVLLIGHSQHEAQATSLAAILPIAAIGAATFTVAGEVDFGLAGLLGVGAVAGAPLGARVMARSGEGILKVAFGALMVVSGAVLLWA
jgi:uncharacterized membrane protein YfcA